MRQIDEHGGAGGGMATHPPILIRCRALLWFSLSEFFTQGEEYWSNDQMAMLDQRVEADLDRFVDRPARRIIEEAMENLGIWVAAYEAIEDGVFKRDEQLIIAELYGEEMLEKLKNFLAGLPSSDAQSAVYERMMTARRELEDVIPNSFETEFEKLKSRIAARFR